MRLYQRGKTWWVAYYDHGTRRTKRVSTRCTDQVAAEAFGRKLERTSAGEHDLESIRVWGSPKSFIYFVRAGKKGPIKVGRSTSPAFRVERLQTGSHEELELLAMIPGGASIERVIHRGLKYSLVRGEWYEPTPLLMGLIKEFAEREPTTPHEG